MTKHHSGTMRASTSRRRVGGLVLAIALAITARSEAANRIEGTVTYAANGRYGFAANALVEVVSPLTGQVVDTRRTDYAGRYLALAPAGKFYVRASWSVAGRILRGSNCCVLFSTTYGRAQGINVLVQ